METISYNSTVSVAQGPSASYKGELKADCYEKLSVVVPSKSHRVLNILPTSNNVVLLSIKADQYPPYGSHNFYYTVGSYDSSSGIEDKDVKVVHKHEISNKPRKIYMFNDHLYVSESIVHLLGKNLSTITFYNEGDDAASLEILTCYNM